MLAVLIIVFLVVYACIGYTVGSLLYYLELLEDDYERWVVGTIWPVVVFLAFVLLVYRICLAVRNCWKRFRRFRGKRKNQKEGGRS